VGYVVSLDGHTVYHAGDTEQVPEMKDVGRVEVMLIPVDGRFTMSAAEAAAAAASIGGALFVPMHYFDTTVADIKAAAKAQPGLKLRLVGIGETLEI
jgi:L-ascorbate metabolism protein UlaG (beta-lactamase superfamily)